MKRRLLTVVACTLVLGMAGCDSGEEPVETTQAPTGQTQSVAEVPTGNGTGDNSESTGTASDGTLENALTIREISKRELIPMSDIVFYEEDDSQPYWLQSFVKGVAKTEDGYLFAGGGTVGSNCVILGRIDKDCTECVMSCTKDSCTHNVAGCEGLLMNYEPRVWAYRDHAYVVKKGQQEILVQLDADGTNPKELFEVARYNGYSGTALTFYNDCVYSHHRDSNNGSNKKPVVHIRRRSLDGKEDEVIVKGEEMYYTFNNMACYGGNLFFTYHTGYSNDYYSMGLYCYDTKTGAVNRVLKDNIMGYAVDVEGRRLYCYIVGEGVYEYDMNTGAKKLIYAAAPDKKVCYITYDGKYLYLDNELSVFGSLTMSRTITVLGTDGTEINTIPIKKEYEVMYGDSDKLFVKGGAEYADAGATDYVMGSVAYINKSEIESAKEFTVVKWK